jgi:hypothetical protein
MKRKRKIMNLATVLVLLLTLNSPFGSSALPNDAAQEDAGTGEHVEDEIIPGDRRIDWRYAGIPGGIPERTNICATIDSAAYGNGTTDATDAIQSALDNCPDEQVVYLPPGTYLLDDTIHLYDYDTLRGAGPGETILKHSGDWLRSMVDMRGSVYFQVTSLHKTYDVLAANKDSTLITLANTAGITPGDILLINQLNDNDLVDQPSPILGLPAESRTYTLSGLTNYFPYTVSLNAILKDTPILTGTLTLTPSDLSLFMPFILKGQ